MPDSVTFPPPDTLTFPPWTDPIPQLANASNMSMAGLTFSPDNTGRLLADYPWIPALVVGCGMAVFLSLSFYSHHKRVRRKRELLMDYLSVLLYSGAWSRGRSVSVLCNTNSLALSQLGRSFKIRSTKKGDPDTSDYLRDKYLMDLVAFSNSHKKHKQVLKRFISAPTERKFRRVAGQLITLNRATRIGRGGLNSLARNLSMPEDFDASEIDLPSSLSEARTSITQGVLLNPTRMHKDAADSAARFHRSTTITEPMSHHSYENVAFSDQTNLSMEPTTSKITQPNCRLSLDGYPGYPVQNPEPSNFYFSQAPALPSMWFVNRPALPPPPFLEADSRQAIERWNINPAPLLNREASVSVTRSSILPQYTHALGMSCYSSRETNVLENSLVIYNGSSVAGCTTNRPCHREVIPGQYPDSHTSAVYSSGKDFANSYYHPNSTGPSHQGNDHALNQPSSCIVSCAKISPAPRSFLQENGIAVSHDPKKDSDKENHRPHNPVQPCEGCTRSLDETGRRQSYLYPDSQDRQTVTYCKSLEDGIKKSPRRFHMQQRINSKNYNPMFPEETQSALSIHPAVSFLPAAFSHLSPVRGEKATKEPVLRPFVSDKAGEESALHPFVPDKGKEESVFHPFVPHRAEEESSLNPIFPSCAPKLQSKLTSRIPRDIRHSTGRSKGHLNKTMSTQSTTALISGSATPPQGFGSVDSEPRSSSTPPCRFLNLHEEHDTSAVTNYNNNNDNDVSSVCTDQLLLHSEVNEEDQSWQVSNINRRTDHLPPILPPLPLSTWEDPNASTMMKDLHKGRSDTLISLDRMSSPTDIQPEIQKTSNVHRLPRFQVRSSINQHRKFLAQHSIAQVLDTPGPWHHLDMDSRTEDSSLWPSTPRDTRI